MEINSIGAYSPDIVYGQLTSPFVPKTLSINAHTPYDIADDEKKESSAISRASFYVKKFPKMRVEISTEEEEQKVPLEVKPTKNEPVGINTSSPNENNIYSANTEIMSFSLSKLSSKDIVNSSLKVGYTPDEAIIISNAQKAYNNSLLITKTPAETLSSCNYRVK